MKSAVRSIGIMCLKILIGLSVIFSTIVALSMDMTRVQGFSFAFLLILINCCILFVSKKEDDYDA